MGMGKCGYQETCKWYEIDHDSDGGCEHYYWSDLESWCDHPKVPHLGEWPPGDIRNNSE